MKHLENKLKIGLILGTMCAFLTAGIVIQVKTVKSSVTTVGKTQTENELRDSVLRWKEKYNNAYEKLEKKETELEQLRKDVSNSNESGKGLSNKLEKYNLLLGRNDLIGKGVIITLKDGESRGIATDVIVHAEDILEVINSLKNAGAEAISVNNGITMTGHYISKLEEAGVQVKVDQVDKDTIVIPKYEGIYKLEYASNIE